MLVCIKLLDFLAIIISKPNKSCTVLLPTLICSLNYRFIYMNVGDLQVRNKNVGILNEAKNY